MGKKLMVLTMVVALLSVGTYAFAEDVVVTANGAKYHKATCNLIKNKDVTTMDKEEAIEQGYTPCKRCFKEDVIVDDQENKDKKMIEKKTKNKDSKKSK